MHKLKLTALFLFGFVLLAGGLAACIVSAPVGGEPVGDLVVDLEVSKPPRLGETAYFTCTIKPRYPDRAVSGAEAWLELDRVQLGLNEDAELVAGAERWEGDVKPDAPGQFSAAIRFLSEGDLPVECRARPPEGYRNSIWAMDVINLIVERDAGRIWSPPAPGVIKIIDGTPVHIPPPRTPVPSVTPDPPAQDHATPPPLPRHQ